MATTAVLTWNAPGGANSINQTIQYKKLTDSTWTVFATVSAATASSTITGLLDNVIYQFEVVNNCSVGGPSTSAPDVKIKIVCPAVSQSSTYNSVTFNFTHVGGDVSKYTMELMNGDGSSSIGMKTFTSPSGSISDSFTGLSGSTAYQLKLTVFAGNAFDFSKTCTNTSFTTAATPVCNAPTAVVATLS